MKNNATLRDAWLVKAHVCALLCLRKQASLQRIRHKVVSGGLKGRCVRNLGHIGGFTELRIKSDQNEIVTCFINLGSSGRDFEVVIYHVPMIEQD